MEKLKWKRNQSNYILRGKGFYISYNPRTFDYNGNETAIVITDKIGNAILFNLCGDHRKSYEKRIASLADCLKFYEGNHFSWRLRHQTVSNHTGCE